MDKLAKQSVIFPTEGMAAAQIVELIRAHKPKWAKAWRTVGDFVTQVHVVYLEVEIEGVPLRRNAELGHYDVDRQWESVMGLVTVGYDPEIADGATHLASSILLDVFNRWMHRGGFMPRVWRKGTK